MTSRCWLLVVAVTLIGVAYVHGANTTVGLDIANYFLHKWPVADTMTTKKWEYTNGIQLLGIQLINQQENDERFTKYVQTFIDTYVQPDGSISPIRTGNNVDVIQTSILLFDAFRRAPEKTQYLVALKSTRDKYDTHPVNEEGGYWHKDRYPNQMWCDSFFMLDPFLMTYAVSDLAKANNDTETCFNIITKQIRIFGTHAFDEEKKIVYHAWDQSHEAAWSHPLTGLSPSVWSRATGWFVVALVEVLEKLPTSHPEYAYVLSLFTRLAEGLVDYQDKESGLWFQVVDEPNLEGNFLESSGSALFTFAMAKARRLNLLPEKYDKVTNAAWRGLQKKIVVTKAENGTVTDLVISGAVPGMGVQMSSADYAARVTKDNAPHVLAATMYAASEMERHA